VIGLNKWSCHRQFVSVLEIRTRTNVVAGVKAETATVDTAIMAAVNFMLLFESWELFERGRKREIVSPLIRSLFFTSICGTGHIQGTHRKLATCEHQLQAGDTTVTSSFLTCRNVQHQFESSPSGLCWRHRVVGRHRPSVGFYESIMVPSEMLASAYCGF